jgi:hypothetical protein
MFNLDMINFANNSEVRDHQKNQLSLDHQYRHGIQKMKDVMDSPFFTKEGVHLTYDLNSDERDQYEHDDDEEEDHEYDREDLDSGNEEDETTDEDSDNLGDDVIPLDQNIKHAAYLENDSKEKTIQSILESDGIFSDDYNNLNSYPSSSDIDVEELNLDLRTDLGVFPVFVGNPFINL